MVEVKMKRNKGFTLIELMVVVAILAIVILMVLGAIDSRKEKMAQQQVNPPAVEQPIQQQSDDTQETNKENSL